MAAPVTAVVVSWNTSALLERCLTALTAEDGVAVHVVDNGSTDGSAALVRERFPDVVLIESSVNLGYGAAVNLVADAAATPWLLVLNADAAPRPGALAALLAAAEADPSAGALAPRLRLPDGSDQHSAHPFPTLGFLAAFNAGLAARAGDRLCLEGAWDPTRARRVPWAIAACLLVRRTAWEDAGGFDPGMWLYAEDLDLGWRLRRAGWHTRHVPDAIVDHESAASTVQAWGADRTLHWQSATYGWLRRRRGPMRARAAYALNRAGALARTYRPPAAWVRADRAVAGRAQARAAHAAWARERAAGWAALHRAAWRRR